MIINNPNASSKERDANVRYLDSLSLENLVRSFVRAVKILMLLIIFICSFFLISSSDQEDIIYDNTASAELNYLKSQEASILRELEKTIDPSPKSILNSNLQAIQAKIKLVESELFKYEETE